MKAPGWAVRSGAESFLRSVSIRLATCGKVGSRSRRACRTSRACPYSCVSVEQLGEVELELGRRLAGGEQLEATLELAGGEVEMALLLEGEGEQLGGATEVAVLGTDLLQEPDGAGAIVDLAGEGGGAQAIARAFEGVDPSRDVAGLLEARSACAQSSIDA